MAAAPDPQWKAYATQAWPIIASVAGAVLSLAFAEKLNWKGKLVAIVLGLTAAVILGPPSTALVNHFWPWLQPAAPGVHFFIGLSAMSTLAPFLQWLRSFAGNPIGGLLQHIAEALLHFKVHKEP